MSQRPEVHVGDLGTVYRVRIQDNAVDFDPSDAVIKHLIFRMPGRITLTKDATVEVGSGAELGQWFLAYTVLAGAGQDGGDFHAAPGRVQVQAYLEWGDGSHYRSNVRTTDDQGRTLKVNENL